MKLIDLLQIPVFQRSRVLAGKSGLSRQVHSVNMMDAPDIIHYLKADELLLTTAYAIRDNPLELQRLVKQMAACECAGLGIKTKRFLQEIPGHVLEMAEKLHFPLIELPMEPSLGEMLHQSLGSIMEKHNEEQSYALQMHREFSRLIMRGKGVREIIDALTPLVGGTVLLVGYRDVFLSGFNTIPDSVLPIMIDQARELIGKENPPEGAFRLCFFTRQDRHRAEGWFFPIRLPQQTNYLIVANANKLEKSPLPRLAVEQAANVIGFERMKQQAVRERTRRFKNEFFEDLVEGRFHSEAEISSLGKRYGLQEPYPCLCVVGRTDPADGAGEENMYSKRDRIHERLKSMLEEVRLPHILFNKKDLFVMLLKQEKNLPLNEPRLTEQLGKFQEDLYFRENIPFSFGIGTPVGPLTDIPVTFKEALNALESGYRSNQSKFIQSYRARELTELLKMIPNEALTDFYNETFGGLLDLPKPERDEIMNTARVYLETHGQSAQTARRLFIHRNTVTYRLNKFEQLTRRNLRDPNDSLRLRMAFLADKWL